MVLVPMSRGDREHFPWVITYVSVHVGTAHQVDTVVVCVRVCVDSLAIFRTVHTVSDQPSLVVDQFDTCRPIPDLLSPDCVGAVVQVVCQSRSQHEESTVRDRVLQLVSGTLEGCSLPTNTTTARRCIPTSVVILLFVVHTLCQREPGEAGRAVRKSVLGRHHSRRTPLHLIVVTLRNKSQLRP